MGTKFDPSTKKYHKAQRCCEGNSPGDNEVAMGTTLSHPLPQNLSTPKPLWRSDPMLTAINSNRDHRGHHIEKTLQDLGSKLLLSETRLRERTLVIVSDEQSKLWNCLITGTPFCRRILKQPKILLSNWTLLTWILHWIGKTPHFLSFVASLLFLSHKDKVCKHFCQLFWKVMNRMNKDREIKI